MTYIRDSFDEPNVASHALKRSRVAAREAELRRRWLWRAVLASGVAAATVIWTQRPAPVVVSEEEMVRRTAPAELTAFGTPPQSARQIAFSKNSEADIELPLVAPVKHALAHAPAKSARRSHKLRRASLGHRLAQ